MTGVLVIDDITAAQLKTAWQRAQQRPIPLDVIVERKSDDQDSPFFRLADRKREPPPRHVEQVRLPNGYRIAISCEEQPAGICMHLSMSSGTPDKTLPRPEALAFVLEALDVDTRIPPVKGRAWIEEFICAPGRIGRAINVVLVMKPRGQA